MSPKSRSGYRRGSSCCLSRTPTDQELDLAFRELYVAYELLEVAFEDYHYDPDEGLELRPEFVEELDKRIADHEAGTAELISLEEVAKEFGVKLNIYPIHTSGGVVE